MSSHEGFCVVFSVFTTICALVNLSESKIKGANSKTVALDWSISDEQSRVS